MEKIMKRDVRIDILRCIAIVAIILAHSEPGGLLFQLRNFDVILMVLLLGTSFYLSNTKKKSNVSYPVYLGKRFKRLIVPTWIFLTVFFVLFYIISLIKGSSYYFNFNDIFMSYSMFDESKGIGYVWIMKVFFLIALISPFLLKLNQKFESNTKYFLVLIISYVAYALLQLLNPILKGSFQVFFENFILYGIGYGLVAAFGMRLKLLSKKELYAWTSAFLIMFLFFSWHYHFNSTQHYKYPPQLYYISYGMFVSLFLYMALNITKVQSLFNNRFIMFIAQNSIWLYFWHIIFIYLLKFFGQTLSIFNNSFITRFIFIFICALIITYIHDLVKKKLYTTAGNSKVSEKAAIK
ncbi:acyltransferase [Priestia megaterium]|jgi:peptidoglycan/LPS O-acetylase OafA/YrhL|uniref:acyltransferase family protein n=1 Tax=Priestia megaterium TaxID=1404 RepID=UPI0021BFAFED|nr:acyltransferase [Priestia megaterium]MCT9852832.1 acyltransferase [Priestia megaterium]MDF1962508.1 acyltransferase [Priestia megaterium]